MKDSADKDKPQKDQPEEPKTEEPTTSTDHTKEDADEPSKTEEAELIDNPDTDEAVEEVTRSESDELLDKQDAAADKTDDIPKPGFFGRLKDGLVGWWQNKPLRNATLLVVFVGLCLLMVFPTTRYWILNLCGVRSSATVTVTDGQTKLPLKGVKVVIGDRQANTEVDGRATLTGIKLGEQHMVIDQVGFAKVDKKLVIGWGSNPLGTLELTATGIRYAIKVSDYLSGKPVPGVVATSGLATATSDAEGLIQLSLASKDDALDPVILNKDGYRDEPVTLVSDPKQTTEVKLVINKPAIYISKQSGKYDVYRSDIDGKNAKVLLPGTGSETSNLSLVTSPDSRFAALVSTRDNQHDSDGFLLNTLTLINVDDGSTTTLGRGAQIQLVDWISSRLIYELVSADSNTPASSKYTVIGYDAAANTRVQLAAAAHLNAVFSAQGSIYFAVAASATDPSVSAAFYRINPDGANKQNVLDKEVWSGQRVNYNTLDLQTAADGWYSLDLISNRPTSVGGPSSYTNRLYSDNDSGSQSLWVDNRDGQGALVSYNVQSAKDTTVVQATGLVYPVRWLTQDAAIYRVVSGNEIADYAVSLVGGSSHKITEVSNTYGFSAGQ